MEPKSAEEWLAVDVVRRQFDRAARYVAEGAEAGYRELVTYTCGSSIYDGDPALFESPLEVVFALWWRALMEISGVLNRVADIVQQKSVEINGQQFRLDFAVEYLPHIEAQFAEHGNVVPRIAVEVDGHAFHERTPEQVACRDRRDRMLQAAGWKVFHFSYSELTRNPADSVGEVFCYTRDCYNACFRR